MFDHIPVGVGSKGVIPITAQDLEEALEMGVDWSLREGIEQFQKSLKFWMFSIQKFQVIYCHSKI